MTELHDVPTARKEALFRSSCASTMDLSAQHPTVDQTYDFGFMIYLAQTCHMIAEGGWFRENVQGSGQILHDHPTAMWHAAGCSKLFTGFDATFAAPECEINPSKVIGTGAITQKIVATLEECVKLCSDTSSCRAYSYATTNCTQQPGCGQQDHMCFIRDNDKGEKDQRGRISGSCRRPSPSLSDYDVEWRGRRCGHS